MNSLTTKRRCAETHTHTTPSIRTHLAFFVSWRCLTMLGWCIALLACQADATPTANVTPIALQLPSTAQTPSATPNRAIAPTLAPSFATPAIVELTVWMSDEFAPTTAAAGASALASQISSFQSTYNNIRVMVSPKQATGKGSLTNLLLATYAVSLTQALPDVIAIDLRELPLIVKMLNLPPLSNEVSPTLQNDLYAFALQAGQVEGQLYALAFTADVLHGVYVKIPITLTIPVTITTIMTTTTPLTPTTGLTPTLSITATPALTVTTIMSPTIVTPTAPLMWSTLLSSTVKYAFAAGGENNLVSDSLLAQYVALGGRFTDARGKLTLERDILRAVLEFYRNGVAQGVFVSNLVNLKTHEDVWKMYQSGKATLVDVNARRYLLERASLKDSEYVALPTRSGNLVTISYAWGYVVVTHDPARRQAALRFIEWMLAADHNAGWNRAASRVPTRRSALLAWSNDPPYREFMQRLLAVAVNRPATLNHELLDTILQNAINEVLLNNLSPDEAADKAVAAVSKQ